jgi:hypothetical protein
MRMRRQSFAILLLLLLAVGRDAHAGRYGLLLYGGLQQEVDLTYQFNGDQQSISSQRHETVEDYTFRMKYGVGRASLWRGSFMTTLRLDQSLISNSRSGSSDASSHIGFLYDIDGVLFGQSVAPAAFSVKSDITEVSTPFAKTYQVTNTLYDFRWSLKNKQLPVAIEYLTGTSETSGQQVDSTRNRKELYLHATHAGTVDTASLDLSTVRSDFNTSNGETNFDKRYEPRFQHTLNWNSDGRARSFATALNYSETAGINFAKYLTLNESAQWELGKSLRSGGEYSFSEVSGDPGSQTRQNGTLWLQHQLFKNLTTRLNFRVRSDNYPTGSDQEVGGGVSLSYVKELPKQGSLTLSGSKDYSADKRNLGTDRQHIFNEQHTAAFGTHLFLAQANAVVSTISVRNADSLKRLLPYDLDSDYRVDVVGAQTEIVILPGGAISDGDSLLVTYDIRVDPNLKTVSDSYGLNGSLQLLGGAYRLYGSYLQTQQERTGLVTLEGLTAQSMTRFGAERKWDLVTVNTEYISFDSEADKHQSVQAQALYSNSKREGNLTLTLSDQYQWYAPVSIGSTVLQRSAENFFSVAAGYNTRLSATTNLALNSNYLNIAGAQSSDSFTLGSSLRWGLGKLNLTLNTSFGVRRQENIFGYNELLFLRVARFF